MSTPDIASPPPTKASLRSWWTQFKAAPKIKKSIIPTNDYSNDAPRPGRVFGTPLRESLKYASVQVSTTNADGELYVWGYIPVVVAKCGLYLKEKATEVPGTFRVNGSAKRMRELQAEFEALPANGKALDWEKRSYTTHDVACVFRRYLTQMPEPVIPFNMYHDFRDAYSEKPSSDEKIIANFKRLIKEMPRPNQYLLLYVLDFLSVFARKSDINLMTASNLAVIFRPGLMSHPDHEQRPQDQDINQHILEFLIAQQDWFILEIPAAKPKRSTTLATADAGAIGTIIEDESVATEGAGVVRRKTLPSSKTKEPGTPDLSNKRGHTLKKARPTSTVES